MSINVVDNSGVRRCKDKPISDSWGSRGKGEAPDVRDHFIFDNSCRNC